VKRFLSSVGIVLVSYLLLVGCARRAASVPTGAPVAKETVIVQIPSPTLPPVVATAPPAPTVLEIAQMSATFPLTQRTILCQKVVDPVEGEVSFQCDGDLLASEDEEIKKYKDEFGKLSPQLAYCLQDPEQCLAEFPDDYREQLSGRQAIPVAIWLEAPLPDSIEQLYQKARLDVSQDLSLADIRAERDALFVQMSDWYRQVQERVIAVLADYGCWGQFSYASTAAPLLYTELPWDRRHPVWAELPGLESVDAIYLAGFGEPKLDSAVPTIKANEVWERRDTTGTGAGLYIDGEGVNIAIVETGRIDLANSCFGMNRGHSTRDASLAIDGHKTRVAAVAASSDYTLTGVAPDAVLLSADCATFGEAGVVAATDWAIAQGADVLNASFGLPKECDKGTDNTFSRYFDLVAFRHMRATTAAAGNESNLAAGTFQYVCSPALGYNVIAVGGITDADTAAWGDDAMYNDSNVKNPISTFDDRQKPEVCAVAEGITTPGFNARSGTSYAAPAVAGIIALLIQREPWLLKWPEATKAILMVSAVHNVNGSSRLDDWEGAGTVVASEADRVVDNNWVRTDLVFKNSLPLKIPFSANMGETVRFAVAWSSHAEKKDKVVLNNLEADLDLMVFDPARNMVGHSLYCDNNYEIVEFTAPATGVYEARVVEIRFNADYEFIASAWDRR
jgi:hypothetical protein